MLGNGFYRKMAAGNIRRSREVYLPYLLAAAIIGCVYFLVVSMSFSENLAGVPGGENARLMFAMGTVVFTIFAFCFLLSINRFLIKQRKKEFGLYGVLGLSKGHVGRILVWENAMVLLGGLGLGLVFALVFGKLLFLALLKLMRSLPSLDFAPPPMAYLAVTGLFLAVFVCTCLYNLAQVHLSNPIQLMQSQRQGEKDSRLVVPKAILGLLLLGAAYYFAWTIQNYGMAMGVFFLLVLMVIIATYFLFQAGSIAVLRLLRANKNFYYQPSHFVSVASMFHRMRQNASSLAGICILSTMLTVTLTGTLALYLGQEETLKPLYPYNVCKRPWLDFWWSTRIPPARRCPIPSCWTTTYISTWRGQRTPAWTLWSRSLLRWRRLSGRQRRISARSTTSFPPGKQAMAPTAGFYS